MDAPIRADVRALLSSRRLALIVVAAAVGLLVLGFADALGQRALWRNAAVTLATLASAAAAARGRRDGSSPTQRLRNTLTAALIAIACAQVASDVQAVIGWEAAPRPSDAIGFLAAIPTILAFTLTAKVRVGAIDVLIVLLDGLTVFVALWVALLLAVPIAAPMDQSGPEVSVVLLAGSFVATMLIVGALWTLARRSRTDIRGFPLFVLGLGTITISWVAIIGGVDSAGLSGHAADLMLVSGILLAGYGATTASLDAQALPHRPSDRPFLVALAPTVVPIACVALMAVLLLVHAIGPEFDIVEVGGGGIVLIATLRMLLLVWERTGLLWRAQVARDEAALLEQASASLLERLDPIGLLETLARRSAALLDGDEAFVYLVDRDRTCLVLETGTPGLAAWFGRRTPIGVGIAGAVLDSKRPLVVNDPAKGPAMTADLPPYAAAAAVPLESNDSIAGVLGLLRRRASAPFDSHELEVLRRLGQLGSIALDHARLYSDARTELIERRQTEAALREAEQRFRSLVERLPGAVYLYPVDTSRAVYLSPQIATLTGYSPEEIDLRSVDLIHPDDRDRVREAWAAMRTGMTSSAMLDYRVVTRDGRVRWLHQDSVLLLGSDGQPAYWQGLITDVTERLELQESLRQAVKMEAVGRLAGGVAHDFNNLLTAIGGFAELLTLDLPDDSPPAALVGQIRHATERAATLTRQLLTFSRRQVVRPTMTDLNDVVGEIEPMLRRLIGEHIAIEVSLAADLPAVQVDRGQIDQLILNLALNARDAMPDGGHLTLRTGVRDRTGGSSEPPLEVDAAGAGVAAAGAHSAHREVLLTVADTGSGIPAEIRDHIFEPFFTTKEPGRGTGLGLATVYGIVEQAGGRIEFTTEPDQGTSFTVALPEVEELARPAGDGPRRLPASGAGRILLVEDDAAVRRLVETLLTRAGFEVTVRADADAAIEAIAATAMVIAQGDAGDSAPDSPSRSFDLAVLDVVMPGMSGPVLATRLLERQPGIGLLFMSGYPRDELSPDRPLPPGSAFLAKPFTGEELVDRVNELLAARAATGGT